MNNVTLVGNRPAYGERNDCTIRALATACGMGYEPVRQYLKLCGRRGGCRFRFAQWLADHDNVAFGFRFVAVPLDFSVARQTAEGTWLLRQPGHVFARVVGVVYDTAGAVRWNFVYQLWRVERTELDQRTAAARAKDEFLKSL